MSEDELDLKTPRVEKPYWFWARARCILATQSGSECSEENATGVWLSAVYEHCDEVSMVLTP